MSTKMYPRSTKIIIDDPRSTRLILDPPILTKITQNYKRSAEIILD